jgi:hypothetical protein
VKFAKELNAQLVQIATNAEHEIDVKEVAVQSVLIIVEITASRTVVAEP